MRMLKSTVLLGMLAVATSAANIVAAQGVNFSGKWMIEAPGRGGQVQRTILVLNQVGTEVDGTITARIDAGTGSPSNTEILDGKGGKRHLDILCLDRTGSAREGSL